MDHSTKKRISNLITRLKRKQIGFFLVITLLFISVDLFAQFSVDAQLRNRFEIRNGYQKLAWHGSAPAVFVSQRTRITFGYETKNLKIKLTPQDVRVWGDETSSSSTGVFGDNSSLELFEAFAEVKTGNAGWLSVGRQQLVYDNERILAARNWNQSGMAYDAIVYKWAAKDWNIHLGSSWNSTGENSYDNVYDPKRIKSLSFLWVKHKISQGWDLSVSHFTSGVTKSATSNTLRFRQTSGLYTIFKTGNLTLWTNDYIQYGKNQEGKNVGAILIDAEAKYKLGTLTPALGLSYLSGNSKTGNNLKTDHLFDVLYGGRHKFFGFIDYFKTFAADTKQGGLVDYYFILDYKFSKSASITNTGHYFQLAQINPSTPENKKLGYENDIVLKYQFSNWGTLESGWFFFLPTASLKTIQGIDDNKFSHFFYLQLALTPSLFKQIAQ